MDMRVVPERPASLAAALAAFQAELPRLGKGSTANAGTFSYRYADLADVSSLILPAIARLGLSFSAKPTIRDGRSVLVCTLRHVSGESDEAEWDLPKGSPQQIGSAITYGRRYTLLAMTGVAPDEDDDGHAASTVERDDPTEDQDRTADDFADEIQSAQSQSTINEIAERVKKSRAAGRITPMQYDRLGRMAAAKVATFVGGSTGATPDNAGSMTDATRRKMFALWRDLGYDGDEKRQPRRDVCAKLLKHPVPSVGALSEADALAVVAGLEKRKRETVGAKT